MLVLSVAVAAVAAADIDACVAFSCSQNAALVSTMGVSAQATCADNPPASVQSGNNTAGRTCTCGAGLTYTEATGCTGEAHTVAPVAPAHTCTL